MKNRKNERMILNSVQNGPLWQTVTDTDGTTQPKKVDKTTLSVLLGISQLINNTMNVIQYVILRAVQVNTKVSERSSTRNGIGYHSPQASTQPMTEFPQMESGLAIPVFNLGDDPIACLNKEMAFLTGVASLRRRQGQSYASNSYKGNATSSRGNNTRGKTRVVKCYNCQGEGHMARQCTQPKRPRNAAWFKEKAMLAEALEAGQILDEEQLAFLTDLGIPDGQAAQTTIPNTDAFQTEDLDAYDSNCDDVSNAKAVLMANLSTYGSDVLSEVPHSKTSHNDMAHVKKMIDSQMDDMIKEKLALKQQIDLLEQNLSNQIKEKESLLQTFTVFKNESKEKENKYIDKEIDLEKKIKELDNIVYKVGQSAQTVHIVISDKHVASPVFNDEDTLMLEKNILAREKERKARTTLLMALPEDHLAKFNKITDAKEMWDAIKSRFEGLHKGYDRFQSLLSQLEIHKAGVSTEDANQKFLRSLPSAWSQSLRIKGSTATLSSTQNVAFVSENTISTNDVSTAYGVSNPSGHNSQYEQTSSYSLLANQSSFP
ncbi:retrovirus-related pol polyprotein from transposon TNT 1-94 [Tanacetum coccineum]